MSAICSRCYHDGKYSYQLKDAWFVQVIRTASDNKKQQCQYIQHRIGELLPMGPVTNYRIFTRTEEDYLHEGEEELLKYIEKALQSWATR